MDGNMVMVGVGTMAARIAVEFQEKRFHGLQVSRRTVRARAWLPFLDMGRLPKRLRR